MSNIGPYLVGAACWIFIGAVAVAGMVTDYKRRRAADLLITPWGWALSMLIGAGVLLRTRPARR